MGMDTLLEAYTAAKVPTAGPKLSESMAVTLTIFQMAMNEFNVIGVIGLKTVGHDLDGGDANHAADGH